MKARDLHEKFDAGEDVSDCLDTASARRDCRRNWIAAATPQVIARAIMIHASGTWK